ncbi:MAG: ATP-binding cassette domain-containing protein [Deltaproteobacteria bacterium]|nr:ATP-binding cassette domain-containing protein [Deltaproteobacteria bacterium]
MINFSNVHKIYPPDQPALVSVDLKVRERDFVFVAGASGAGKSTLLKLMFGAERATRGEVLVVGRNLSEVGAQGIAYLRREIGIIFQDYKLLTRRSVIDNVAFGLEVLGVKKKPRYDLAMQLLEVLGLADRAHSLPPTLSGGEQQRVAIARALIHKPRLILADEPTGNLDPDMTKVVFDLLLEANAAGVTVLVATHNLAVIEELNLRTIVLDNGKIIGNFQSPRALG